VIVLALHEAVPDELRIGSFARVCEWTAERAGARVAAVLPDRLRNAPVLDPIAYRALSFLGHARFAVAGVVPSAAAPGSQPSVYPVLGRPHPMSEVELRLARRLERDAELAPLFQFNQRLTTVRNSTPLVDLLWREGRVIVEIDGFEVHRSRIQF